MLLSVAPDGVALKWLKDEGKKWTGDIEVKRVYIDLLFNAKEFCQLRDFCQDEIEEGVDDWKVVKGWIDGSIGALHADLSNR